MSEQEQKTPPETAQPMLEAKLVQNLGPEEAKALHRAIPLNVRDVMMNLADKIPNPQLLWLYAHVRSELIQAPEQYLPVINEMGLTEEYQQWSIKERQQSEDSGHQFLKTLKKDSMIAAGSGLAGGALAAYAHKKFSIPFIGRKTFAVLAGAVGLISTGIALFSRSANKAIEMDVQDTHKVEPFILKLAERELDERMSALPTQPEETEQTNYRQAIAAEKPGKTNGHSR